MPPCAGPGQRVGAGQPAPGFSARQPKRRWTSGASLRPPGFGTPRQTPRGTGMLRPPATACANAEKGGGRVHAKPDGSSSACTAAGRRRCKGCGAKAAALTSRSWLLGGASCSFERTPATPHSQKWGSCYTNSVPQTLVPKRGRLHAHRPPRCRAALRCLGGLGLPHPETPWPAVPCGNR